MSRLLSRSGCTLFVLALTVSMGFWGRPSASGQGLASSGENEAHEYVVESYY